MCTDTWVTTKAPGAQPYERAVSGGLGPADRGRGGCCWTGVWRAHTHSLSTLPALISPFCSACRGPGQQGRETQAEGDHLRLWGERVRGELSTREPAPEVPHWQRAGLRVLALPRGQRGAAPLQAQPAPPLVVLGCGLGPGPPSPPWTAGHGLSRPLPPGLLWAHLVWILDVIFW